MQKHARAVVIGGGCVGAGVLLGLARRGWTDVVMLERTRLTAGSTWHAAGLIPSYARSRPKGLMIQKSIEIYEGLEAASGLSVARTASGAWQITTTKGVITAEHVIGATGNCARQTGAVFGLDLPCIPILHQYWITDPVPAIRARRAAGLPEMPILRVEAF